MNRREFLKLAPAVLATQVLNLPRTAPAAGRQPSVIWIMADDLGYGDLGCYGQQTIPTPQIDQMANEGLRFTQGYSAAPVCSPARWCLMTGRSPKALPSFRNDVRLSANDATVAQVFKSAGYTTALVGKWGLGEIGNGIHPNDAGFDVFYGYWNHAYAHLYYPQLLWKGRGLDLLRPNWTGNGSYSHDLFINAAIQFLSNAPDPYFLYLPFTLPHTNNELAHVTGNGLEVPEINQAYLSNGWTEIDKCYATMVSMIDHDVGRILDAVRGTDTLIIFTSDNGPNYRVDYRGFFDSTGGLRGAKTNLYEGGIRVPMIAWWPGMIRPGVSDYVWSFTDFLATAADLAGVAPPASDGVSIVPALLGTGTPDHPPLYWHFLDMQAARVGDWKAVQNGDAPAELYDLAADPGEMVDLSDAYPGLAGDILTEVTKQRIYLPYVTR